jgi:hypothetical protein
MRDFQNVDMQNRIDAQRAARQLTQADIVAMVTMFPDFSTPSLIFATAATGPSRRWRGAGASRTKAFLKAPP